MKRKTFSWICLMVLLMVCMTGCGGQIPDMTDAQRAEISEYAAGLLMKYSTNSSSRLVNVEELEEEVEKTPAPIPQATEEPQENVGMDETEETPIINSEEEVSPEAIEPKDVLGLPEMIAFQYNNYQIVDSYTDPINSELIIEAAEGNKLLVCEFVLINDGAEKQSVDMLKESISYVMQIGEGVKMCSMTMLSNDLTTYLGILSADEARSVILITEYEESKLHEAENISLKIQREEQVAIIQIK